MNWYISERCPDFNEETHQWQGEGYPDDKKLVIEIDGLEDSIELYQSDLIELVDDIRKIINL